MKYIFPILALSVFILFPMHVNTAFAAGVGSVSTGNNIINSTQTASAASCKGLCNPLKVSSLSNLLTDILGFLVEIGTIVVILMLIYTGFKFVIAQGKPAEIEKVRMMLLWTIIGALIILGAQAISMGISATVTTLSA